MNWALVDSASSRTPLRRRGAASIALGRTPHEVRDEMCRADTTT